MPRLRTLTLALAALAVLAGGCSKKITTADATFTVPEGVPSSNLELITFFDRPNQVILIKDRGNLGTIDFTTDPNVADSIVLDVNTLQPEIFEQREFTSTTVRGLIVNRTPAEGMELFRSETNGGLRYVFSEPLQPEHRYIDQNVETYSFADTDPKRANASNYISRGLIGGLGSKSSPLSNVSRPVTGTLAEIQYLPRTRTGIDPDISGLPSSNDSILTLKWSAVPNTDHYWIQIFQYLPTLLDQNERIFSGAPAPLVTRKVRDFFIATVPGNVTRYKMGTAGATIYTARTMNRGDEYFVRISAVDADGELIGMTTGPHITQTGDLVAIKDPNDYFSIFGAAGTYFIWSRGAVRITPVKLPVSLIP